MLYLPAHHHAAEPFDLRKCLGGGATDHHELHRHVILGQFLHVVRDSGRLSSTMSC
jgi:hypothetical protein